MHDIALHKEKAFEELQEKYKHVCSTYEQRTKETLDLQAKVMRLEKKIIELEEARPKSIGESSEMQPDPNTRCGKLPYSFQGQQP